MPAPEPILEARDLVRLYRTRHGGVGRGAVVRAVNGVSFTLHAGETLGLVGESGCGKSTVAKLLMGLERPTAGTILHRGRDIRTRRRADRRLIQMVMQDPYSSLDPRMTVRQIVREPLDIHREGGSAARDRRVGELLDVVGLDPEHRDRYPHEFSGGQRQRIGIARALALEPEILICDEPVSALDVSIQAQILNLLKDLQERLGLACVFISHDLSVVRQMSDRIAVMYLGGIVEIGSEPEIFGGATHPYTQALLASAPHAGAAPLRADGTTVTLTGEIPDPADPPSGCRFRTRCWLARDVCATDPPPLVPHPPATHPSACHFAAPLLTPSRPAL